jgi:GT2 family glycosyltransferase
MKVPKVTIVAAYNTKVEMTIDFLSNLQGYTQGVGIEEYMILVNGGCHTQIEHPFIDKRIDLKTNIGFCNTLNEGLKAVPEDSDYVFFVGNDSFPISSDWLPKLIELQKQTDAWMVCPANDRPGMTVYNHLYTADKGEYWEANFFPSIAWLMPYDKFKEIGLLDEGYIRTGMYADNDYCDRIKEKNGLIVVSKNILLKHLLSAEGQVLGTGSVDMAINGDYYRNKWHSKK